MTKYRKLIIKNSLVENLKNSYLEVISSCANVIHCKGSFTAGLIAKLVKRLCQMLQIVNSCPADDQNPSDLHTTGINEYGV